MWQTEETVRQWSRVPEMYLRILVCGTLRKSKQECAVAINQITEARHLSQTAAARLLDINQPKISALVNYRLEGFSVERLMHFLNALDRDVEIVIRKKPLSSNPGSANVYRE